LIFDQPWLIATRDYRPTRRNLLLGARRSGAYLTLANPMVDPVRHDTGVLEFGNAAVQYGFASPLAAYDAASFVFDSATGASKPIRQRSGVATGLRAAGSADCAWCVRQGLRPDNGANKPAAPPTHAYFRRLQSGGSS